MRKGYMISQNLILMVVFASAWALMAFTCEVPSIEVEDREFILTKEWKAKEIVRTGLGDPVDIDIESYRLLLNEDFTFEKTEFSGSGDDTPKESGKWNLISNQSQLELVYDADSTIHRYLIISLQTAKPWNDYY